MQAVEHDKNTTQRRPFWILSIDGGGIRGAFAAHLLKRIGVEFGIDFKSRFDVVAGTSTGSIIAAALAVGIPLDRVEEFYLEHGTQIFKFRWWAATGMFFSRYDPTALRELLTKEFKDLTLGNLSRPALIIPAVDIGNGRTHLFKSQYDAAFVRDRSVRVADAILASCSAPLYFPPHVVGPYRLADGGMWANNPSLVAAVDAVRRFGKDLSDIRLLSIGTGIEHVTFLRNRFAIDKFWGFLTGWGSGALLEFMLNLQSQMAMDTTQLLLGGNVLRLSFADESLPLDDPSSIPDLTARADMLFTHKSDAIHTFLEANTQTSASGATI